MADPPFQQTWPTIEKNSGHASIHKDQVKKRIDALVQNYNKYDDYTGTPHDLTSQMGEIQPADIGAAGGTGSVPVSGDGHSTYPGGQAVWGSISNIKANFPQQYQEFLNTYNTVIDNLYKQAGITERADIDSSISTAGTTGTTGTPPPTQNPYDSSSGQT